MRKRGKRVGGYEKLQPIFTHTQTPPQHTTGHILGAFLLSIHNTKNADLIISGYFVFFLPLFYIHKLRKERKRAKRAGEYAIIGRYIHGGVAVLCVVLSFSPCFIRVV